jgi:pectin methylesterase-like acyl-CoA thioesterase
MKRVIFVLMMMAGMAAKAAVPQCWDFGAEQVVGMQNMLTAKEINSWFPAYPSGTMSAALLSFTASDSVNLRYYAHGAHNHRLRTTNPILTHTDEKSVRDSAGTIYHGMIYANSNSDPDIYIEQFFNIGDTIEYVLSSNNGPEHYRFYLSDSSYYATCFYPGKQGKTTCAHYRFVCPKNGHYRLSGVDEKLIVARIIRYPLDRQLSKRELSNLKRQARHPLKKQTLKVRNADYPDTCRLGEVAYKDTIWVGGERPDHVVRINDALNMIRHMRRDKGQTVVVMIEPGNYEEMLRIDIDDVTLSNAARFPSIRVMNGGVDIAPQAVRITGYYGYGYNYFSMNSRQQYDPRTLRANRKHKAPSTINKGGSDSNYWNAVVIVSGRNFRAENIIFENSFNQYISLKESGDSVIPQTTQAIRPKSVGSTEVQQKRYRERAAAIAFIDSANAVLQDCRVISRQDALYGGDDVHLRVNGGVIAGSVDYIFGGMTMVCDKTDLVLLVSSEHNDRAYITASRSPQSHRGMLFYRCHVRGAIPGVEMAETVPAHAGYFGRPWSRSGETVFYETRVDTLDDGTPLIMPVGWSDGLTGVGAPRSYEYHTTNGNGDNADTSRRAEWSTILSMPVLPDGTIIDPEIWR